MSAADERISILAVDDSPDKLLALTALLSELGQDLVTATSGRDALRLLLQRDFAVVLLDVRMPGMDGFETAALMRQRKRSEHTPIIFITAFGDDLLAARGYSLGAVDYILAPVEPDTLRTKVSVFVELFRKTAEVRRQADVLAHRANQLQKLTQASLAINSALSPDRILEVVGDFARDVLGAHQSAAAVAVDPRWSSARGTLVFSSPGWIAGDWPWLRDRQDLLTFLARGNCPVREPRRAETPGWLVALMTARDGRRIGLLQVSDKRDGDFTEEDEGILTQLAQMGSIAIENSLNAEAREANRIKDEFLTTLSHELRTPLAAMSGWTRILRTTKLDDERAVHGLEVIERNLQSQTRLIDDLLDVSRIITGKLRLNVRKASLAAVIEAAMDAMRPAAEAKDIRLTFENSLAPDEDAVTGDPDRLQQVVWNVVSNAIKFTPPRGRVALELSTSADQFVIRITDTGRGIDGEFLPFVFDRFRQADSATTRTHTGLGVGLAVARHLVELHGGTIAAESSGEDLGATFSISLPRSATAGDVPASRPAPIPAVPGTSPRHADLTGLRILVVEDDPDNREVVEQVLRGAGATVAAAASGAEGLALVREVPPDVLVSDIGMPDHDGIWLIERVRELPPDRGGAVPALAVSAYAREEDRVRAIAAGFQSHIAKPFEPAQLTASVARLARGEKQSSSLRVLVVEDDGDCRDGLKDLLEVWGHTVEVAQTGTEGVDKALSGRPGVALIDIGLPEIDGYEVAQRIRRTLGRDGIYLVALTGYAADEDADRARTAGFDAHLTKPVSIANLSTLLASRLAN
jgi:CheY-like chemotaxis protein